MDFVYAMSGFWVGVTAAFMLVIALIAGATGRNNGTAVLFILAALVFTSLTQYSPLSWTWENWPTAIMYFSIYLMIGVVWSTFAWFIHLRKKAAEYESHRAKLLPKYFTARGISGPLRPEDYADFREFMQQQGNFLPSNNLSMDRSVMAGQILFWPFKVVGFILGDFLSVLVDAILGLFGGWYRAIQRYVFRKFPELG